MKPFVPIINEILKEKLLYMKGDETAIYINPTQSEFKESESYKQHKEVRCIMTGDNKLYMWGDYTAHPVIFNFIKKKETPIDPVVPLIIRGVYGKDITVDATGSLLDIKGDLDDDDVFDFIMENKWIENYNGTYGIKEVITPAGFYTYREKKKDFEFSKY
jgi:hypothetical protein